MKLSVASLLVLCSLLAVFAPAVRGQLQQPGQIWANSTVTGRTNLPPNLITPSQGYCDVIIDTKANTLTSSVVLNNARNLFVVHLHQGSPLNPDFKSDSLITLYTVPSNAGVGNNLGGQAVLQPSRQTGALANQPNFNQLAALIQNNGIYCDVHAPPANGQTKPGASQIRGQMYQTYPIPSSATKAAG